jgi:hypothetical protein
MATPMITIRTPATWRRAGTAVMSANPARRHDFDALMEIRAGAERRLPAEAGAAETLRHHTGHWPRQAAAVARRDVALGLLLGDEVVNRSCQGCLCRGGDSHCLGENLLVRGQLREVLSLLR